MKKVTVCMLQITMIMCLILISIILLPYNTNFACAIDYQDGQSLSDFAYDLFGDYETINIEYLYNINDSPDYIYMVCENGYAVILSQTFELSEYSPYGKLPYSIDLEKKYYMGPGNYYKKENGYFINILTNVVLEVNEKERNEIACEILNSFKSNDKLESLSNNQMDLSSFITPMSNHYPDNSDDLEKADLPSVPGTHYINNYEYFLNNPKHGDNTEGTCGAVATQLLLSYNNYYNDRRIIADNFLNGWDSSTNSIKYPQLNPNSCSNPIVMSSQTIGSSGKLYNETGTYYSYIVNKIPASSSLHTVKTGIDSILKERNKQIDGNIDYDVKYEYKGDKGNIDESIVINEINENRPLYLSLRGSDSGHAVVAYGYQRKNSIMGYIAHFGWTSNFNTIWVNSSWCRGYVAFKINHVHSYKEVDINNTTIQSEYKCKECGQRTIEERLYDSAILNQTYSMLYGLKYQVEGRLTIPTILSGKPVYSIEQKAFSDIAGISHIEFEDDSQLQVIDDCAFENCSNLQEVSLSDSVVRIGKNAFKNCQSLIFFNITSNSSLVEIGQAAFMNCIALLGVNLPKGLTIINEDTFRDCELLNLINLSSVEFIGPTAFCGCKYLKNVSVIRATFIGEYAFGDCESLTSLLIDKPKLIRIFSSVAFDGCNQLVLYTTDTKASSDWDYFNVPYVINCNFSEDQSYVMTFEKSDVNPYNLQDGRGNLIPYRRGYDFGGWYTNADYSGTQYMNVTTAPNGTLYAKWIEKESCVAEGTMITLADGTQKAVEQLTGDEMLLVWNMFTGKFDVAPILFIDSEPLRECEVINLNFSDGTSVKVISEHAFWDFDLNRYVYLRADADKYIGHLFNKQVIGANGELEWAAVQLVGVELTTEITRAYSPVTYGHLCYYVNGMLSMPGGIDGLFNILEVDADTMKIDEAALQRDIEKYGLFTYEEFAELVPVSEFVFDAISGQYLKIAIGKGLIDIDTLSVLYEKYSEFLIA